MNRLSACRTVVLAGTAAILGGCFGGEPSASNMLEALKQRNYPKGQIEGRLPFDMHSSQTAVKQVTDTAFVDKSACAGAQGQPGYMCDFRIGYTFQGKTHHMPRMSARFFKASDGWQFALR